MKKIYFIITKLKIILLISFIITLDLQGQELKSKQIRKIESFGIEYNRLILENPNYSKDFLNILKKDRKRKRNKTLGYIFRSLGILTATTGILTIAAKDNNSNDQKDESGAFKNVIGGLLTATGVVEIGVSIPLFKSSKKRKRERNQLIYELNPEFKE